MIIFGIFFHYDLIIIEFFSPEFLNLLDFMFESFVLFFAEHVLKLIVEVLLSIFDINFE